MHALQPLSHLQHLQRAECQLCPFLELLFLHRGWPLRGPIFVKQIKHVVSQPCATVELFPAALDREKTVQPTRQNAILRSDTQARFSLHPAQIFAAGISARHSAASKPPAVLPGLQSCLVFDLAAPAARLCYYPAL